MRPEVPVWLVLLSLLASAGSSDEADIGEVLDRLHRAAAEADAETYWSQYAEDAVFVGTDPGERWDLAAFRAYAEVPFEEAPAWTYIPHSREVHLGPGRRTAWFYETLDHARYGRVRGSGALRREGKTWRITQYVLSFPIPNDKAKEVLTVVAEDGTQTLPTPFTASAIASRYQPGFTSVHAHGSSEGVRHQRTTVVSVDGQQVTMTMQGLDASGAPAGEPRTFQARFEELRDHAAFPRSATTWTDEVVVEVPAGRFTTRHYVVRSEADESHFWFDLTLPGPPVRMEVRAGDELVSSMELVE